MKISPVPPMSIPTVDPQTGYTPSRVDSIRSLKMATNATPLANQQQPLPISGNDETQATVESVQPLSPQLALIAKKQRALQQRQRDLEIREKALQGQPTGSPGIDAARLKQDPLGVFAEVGLSYDDLTQAILNGQGNSEINALNAKIEALQKGIDQKFDEHKSNLRKDGLSQIKHEITSILDSKPDDFELIRALNHTDSVVGLIDAYHQKEGIILPRDVACQWIEEQLLEDQTEEYQKLAKLKKLQSLMAPPQPAPQQRSMGMRTLTNRDTASVPLSSKARAMAAFYGTLPKK